MWIGETEGHAFCSARVRRGGANGHEQGGRVLLLGFDMHSDGSQIHHLTAKVCGAKAGKVWQSDSEAGELTSYDNIGMNGQDVFKFAVRAVPMTIKESLKNANMHRGNRSLSFASSEPKNHRRRRAKVRFRRR